MVTPAQLPRQSRRVAVPDARQAREDEPGDVTTLRDPAVLIAAIFERVR